MKPQIEPRSDTWKAVEAYANERLEKLRLQNDSTAMDSIQTAVIRGRIAALKELLALAEAPANLADDSEHIVY